MPKLTDMQIRAWIKAGDRFDGKADGNGLYICYPKNYTVPFWRFRYKLAGKQRAMVIGSYSELSLSKARETAKELSARVALGYDVAAEKQERKAEALAKMEAEKNAMRVSDLASEYFERQILPRWKHPDILRRRIDKDINPCIGHMKVNHQHSDHPHYIPNGAFIAAMVASGYKVKPAGRMNAFFNISKKGLCAAMGKN